MGKSMPNVSCCPAMPLGRSMLSGVALLSVLLVVARASTAVLTLRATYPDVLLDPAQRFYLRGNNLGFNWTTGMAMTHVATNTWQLSVPYSSKSFGQTFEFKTLIDDNTWSLGGNFFFTLPGFSSAVDCYPYYFTKNGMYRYVRNITSPQLNNTRDLVVYTPPSYNENFLKVYRNVLVMHDGQNLFNDSTSFAGISWRLQPTLDGMIYAGQLDDVVVVGVDNTDNRINEYTYSYDPSQQAGGEANLYLEFLEQTVLPLIKTLFRVQWSQDTLGILGSSLGGLVSCWSGYTRNGVWGKAGCMSSSFWWNSGDFNNTILKEQPPLELEVYLDSGNAGPSDDDWQDTVAVRNHMEALGFKLNDTIWYYLDQGGQHSEAYWGARFHIPAGILYPPQPLVHTP